MRSVRKFEICGLNFSVSNALIPSFLAKKMRQRTCFLIGKLHAMRQSFLHTPAPFKLSRHFRTPDHHRSSNFLIGLRHSASRRSQHSTAEAKTTSKKWHKRSGSFGALLMGKNGKEVEENAQAGQDGNNNNSSSRNAESDCCDCHSDNGSSW